MSHTVRVEAPRINKYQNFIGNGMFMDFDFAIEILICKSEIEGGAGTKPPLPRVKIIAMN